MEFMFEWEQEGDRFSFEDSDRFEEDSLCSWISEPESLCNNWRGWRKPNTGGGASAGGLLQNQLGIHNGPLTASRESSGRTNDGQIQSLVELAAQGVAYHIPFEVVERFFPPIPEQLQLRIAFWSFPENEEDIRLYSCLANGSADEFQKGEQLFKGRAVNNALQIGFHLSATVVPLQPAPQTAGVSGANADPSKMACNVALVFDRRHITSCSCTCASGATWCAHVVALCLFRIHQSSQVRLRAPVSESLSRLERDQLQKFAQYLISELPQQILPTAQRLLDELLSSQQTEINTLCGAPDPTAGPSASDLTRWHLDSSGLQENIKKTLNKFCVPSPMVLSDVNYLSNSAPPAATEWQTLLRPLRGREPEGIWNLLSIVREMFRRNDSNAVTLLDIITEELLSCDQILNWWFNNKTSNQSNIYFHGNRGGGGGGGGQGSGGGCSTTAPHAAAGLCDEVVTLWRLAALNPSLSVSQRSALCTQLRQFHTQCLERIRKAQLVNQHQPQHGAAVQPRRSELESMFPGFKPAIDACQLDWTNLTLPSGVGELLKHRGHWSLGNSKLPTSPATVSLSPVTDHTTDGNVSGRESGSDVSVRPKEIGRKVLMPSERPAHSVRPWGSTTRKSDREDVDNTGADRNSAELMSPSCASDTKQATESTSSVVVAEETSLESATKTESQLDILFALAEALHAHGNTKEACKLARQLAEEMLSSTNTSEFSGNTIDNNTHHAKGDKVRKATVQSFAGSTLAKASFLCTVLLEDHDSRHLAFRVGLYGMEMARPPAANKSLEVKLAHQESELANQLKKLPLGPAELAVIRDRAEKLRDGKLKTRGDSLLPVTLASFIFDSLCANQVVRIQSAGQLAAVGAVSNLITPQDEKLGFEAAVAALGLKANLTEAEHPILCEGTRRQKGELAVAMLVQYKDDTSKLARIMDKLLDKEVHQLYKSSGHDAGMSNYLGSKHDTHDSSASKDTTSGERQQTTADEGIGVEGHDDTKAAVNSTSFTPAQNNSRHSSSKSKTSQAGRAAAADDLALDDDTEGSGDYKAWEAKFRCTNLKTAKKHSVGMASVDSSAPETTSSDNSPTLVRRSNFSNLTSGVATPLHHGGPGSDSGSSHSDSVDSSSSGCKQSQQPQQLRTTFKTQQQPEADSFLNSYDSASGFTPQMCVYTRTSGVGAKGSRYKVGKNRIMPLLPNQPSEASAHFMFELAKTVLIKAGGNSSTSLFVNQPPAASSSQTHRALHLCALQIGLYALGLNNCVSPNWLSRTYSSHVSWITGQAIEIGYHAVEVLIKTWEGHLTPQEAASLADRASRCRDQHMVRAAAELALSCLPHAHALNPQEIQRALLQCKEQSSDMLQRACLSVENTAKEGGVCPEVLFEVAKRWYELYEERGAQGSSNPSRGNHHPSAVAPPLSAAAAAAAFQDLRDNAIAMVSMPPPIIPDNVAIMQMSANSAGPAAVMNPNMTGYPPPGSVPFVPQQPIQLMTHPYAQYTYMHPMAAANQQSAPQPRQNFPYYTAVPMQTSSQTMHLARYPYQGPYMTTAGGVAQPSMSMPPPPIPQMGMGPAYLPGSTTMYNMSSVRPPPVQLAYLTPVTNMLPPVSSGYSSAPQMLDPNIDQHHYRHPSQQQQQQQQQQHHQAVEELSGASAAAVGVSNDIHINYLLAAFRVGMLAMDTLAKRVHDDRPQIKYARNPPYGEDVKWLFGISCKLGTSYLQQFCASVVNTIVSPFVLLDIAMETASFLAINNMSQVSQQIRLPMLNSLLQKCLQMFGMCTQTRLHHIASTDYDDFVNIVCSARNAFCMVPGGMTQFNDMLQAIRRSKYCKKDLWQRVISGLHSTSNV